jgi:hypothetical protein
MTQVTLYLDAETAERMKKAALASGLSQSRWLTELVRERTAREWPEAVNRLAGAWRDFPDAPSLRRRAGRDARRARL